MTLDAGTGLKTLATLLLLLRVRDVGVDGVYDTWGWHMEAKEEAARCGVKEDQWTNGTDWIGPHCES